ncbi:hypothetical protein BSKO_05855 [Bryopsis sp. KO-2023]|nr:hypothetical protein BSKO_05855 [Bryopsis sp. KO-2023]
MYPKAKRRPSTSGQNQGSRKKRQAGSAERSALPRPKTTGGISGGKTTLRQADPKNSPLRATRSQVEEAAARPRLVQAKGCGKKKSVGGLNFDVDREAAAHGKRGVSIKNDRQNDASRLTNVKSKSSAKRQPLQRDVNRINQQEQKAAQPHVERRHLSIPTTLSPKSKKPKGSMGSFSVKNETMTAKKVARRGIFKLRENPKSSQEDVASPRQPLRPFQIKRKAHEEIDLMTDALASDEIKNVGREGTDRAPPLRFLPKPANAVWGNHTEPHQCWREPKAADAGLGLAPQLALLESEGHGPDFRSSLSDERQLLQCVRQEIDRQRNPALQDAQSGRDHPVINNFLQYCSDQSTCGKSNRRNPGSESGLETSRSLPPFGNVGIAPFDRLINLHEYSETASVVSQGNSYARREMERAESVASIRSSLSKDFAPDFRSSPFGGEYTGTLGVPFPGEGRLSAVQDLTSGLPTLYHQIGSVHQCQVRGELDSNRVSADARYPWDSSEMPQTTVPYASVFSDVERAPSMERSDRIRDLFPFSESLFSGSQSRFPLDKTPAAHWGESSMLNAPLSIPDRFQEPPRWTVPVQSASPLGSPQKSELGGFEQTPLAFDPLLSVVVDPVVEAAEVSQVDFGSPVECPDRLGGAAEREHVATEQAVGGSDLADLACWDSEARAQTPSALRDIMMKEADRYAAVNAAEQKLLDLDVRVHLEAGLKQKAALDVLDTEKSLEANEPSFSEAREEHTDRVAVDSQNVVGSMSYVPSTIDTSTMTDRISLQHACIQTVDKEPKKPVMRDASTATDLESEIPDVGCPSNRAEASGETLATPSSENRGEDEASIVVSVDSGPSIYDKYEKALERINDLQAELQDAKKENAFLVEQHRRTMKEALKEHQRTLQEALQPSKQLRSIETQTSVKEAPTVSDELSEVSSAASESEFDVTNQHKDGGNIEEEPSLMVDIVREESDMGVVHTKASEQEEEQTPDGIHAIYLPEVGSSLISDEIGEASISRVVTEGGNWEVLESLRITEGEFSKDPSSGNTVESTPQAVSSEEFDMSEESISEKLEINSSPPVEPDIEGPEERADALNASLTEALSVPESILEEDGSIVESVPESGSLRESEGQVSLGADESLRSSAATSSSNSSDSDGPSWLTSSKHLKSVGNPSDEVEPQVTLIDFSKPTEELQNPVETTDLSIESVRWQDEDVEAGARTEQESTSRDGNSIVIFDTQNKAQGDPQSTSSGGDAVAHLADDNSRQPQSVSDFVPSVGVLHESQSLLEPESTRKLDELMAQPDRPSDEVESGSDGTSNVCESVPEESLNSTAQSSSEDIEALYQIGSTNEDLERIADEVELDRQESQGSGGGKQSPLSDEDQMQADCEVNPFQSRQSSSSDKDIEQGFDCGDGVSTQDFDVSGGGHNDVEPKQSHSEELSLDKDEMGAANDSVQLDASMEEDKSLSSVSECYSDQFTSQSSDDKPYKFDVTPAEACDALPTPPEPSTALRDHPEPLIGRLPPILPTAGTSISLPVIVNIPTAELTKPESDTKETGGSDEEIDEGESIDQKDAAEVHKGGVSSSASSSISEEQMECEASGESDLDLEDYTERELDLQKSLTGSQDDGSKSSTKEEARVGSSESDEFDLSNPDDLDDVEIEFEGEVAKPSSEGSEDSAEKGGAVRLAVDSPMDIESGLGLDASLDAHDDKDLEINWQEDYIIPEQAASSSEGSVAKEECKPTAIEKRIDSFDEVERVEVRSDGTYVNSLIARWMEDFDLGACANDVLDGMDFSEGPVSPKRFLEVEAASPTETNEQKEYNLAIFEMMNEALLDIHAMHQRPRVRQLTHELQPSRGQILTEVQRRVMRWINSQGSLEDLLQESLWEWDE